jgi:hypothetical protein
MEDPVRGEDSMLRYLSKFLLDIAPPVAATVIGAWIVTHYIAPKTDAAAQPKAEAAEVSAPKQPLSGASGMAPRTVEQVTVKPVADEAAEAKKPAHEKPAVKQAVAAPRVEDEREGARDATDLARAALDRLRSQTPPESPRSAQAAVQSVAAPAATPVVPASPPAVAATAVLTPSPAALPPSIVIAPQREAVAPSPMFGETARPTPPAEIPVRSADASAGSVDGRSLIGGIASAAKSLVDVVVPR